VPADTAYILTGRADGLSGPLNKRIHPVNAMFDFLSEIMNYFQFIPVMMEYLIQEMDYLSVAVRIPAVHVLKGRKRTLIHDQIS
jgi:hypothetical protein